LYPVVWRLGTNSEEVGAFQENVAGLTMLSREDQLKILRVFNLAIQPIEPQLVVDEVELFRLSR